MGQVERAGKHAEIHQFWRRVANCEKRIFGQEMFGGRRRSSPD